jgi:hypothetical protein
MARAFAEHWLMFFYKASYSKRFHATTMPDEDSRRFSMHKLEASGRGEEFLFFETTESWQREGDDFRDFLREYEETVTTEEARSRLAADNRQR